MGGLVYLDRKEGCISGKLPWINVYTATCFCDCVAKQTLAGVYSVRVIMPFLFVVERVVAG